jgi:hypothetical protein
VGDIARNPQNRSVPDLPDCMPPSSSASPSRCVSQTWRAEFGWLLITPPTWRDSGDRAERASRSRHVTVITSPETRSLLNLFPRRFASWPDNRAHRMSPAIKLAGVSLY